MPVSQRILFVLPDQCLQYPEVHCNFPLCNSKISCFFCQILDHAAQNWGCDEGTKALISGQITLIYKLFDSILLMCLLL